MSQVSTGKPLGYYGCDTSLSAMQTLQAAYGSVLERMSIHVKISAIVSLLEVLAEVENLSVSAQESVNLSYLLKKFHEQGGREQTIALLRAIVERL